MNIVILYKKQLTLGEVNYCQQCCWKQMCDNPVGYNISLNNYAEVMEPVCFVSKNYLI